MHATGQTRMHAWSMTSMQGSAITKVMLLTSLLPCDASESLTGVGTLPPQCGLVSGNGGRSGQALRMTAHPHDGGAYGKRQQQTPHYRPLGPTESRTGSPPLRSLEPYTQDGRRPMRLLPHVLVRLHTVEQPQHTWLTSLVRRLQFDDGIEDRG